MTRWPAKKCIPFWKWKSYNTIHCFYRQRPRICPSSFYTERRYRDLWFSDSHIAWGQRKSIIQKSLLLMKLMDEAPYDFIMNANGQELKSFENFVYRTFNGTDCCYFILALKHLYREQGGMGKRPFSAAITKELMRRYLISESIFIRVGWSLTHRPSLANPLQGSAAKRRNMFSMDAAERWQGCWFWNMEGYLLPF